MKQLGVCCRIAPFAVLKCRHVEVDKHAEPQIDKSLLQIKERACAGRHTGHSLVLFCGEALLTGEHRGRRGLGGKAEKVSSRCHFAQSGVLTTPFGPNNIISWTI